MKFETVLEAIEQQQFGVAAIDTQIKAEREKLIHIKDPKEKMAITQTIQALEKQKREKMIELQAQVKKNQETLAKVN